MSKTPSKWLTWLSLAALAAARPQAPAPAPAPESISVLRCQSCPKPAADDNLSLDLELLVQTDVAQFYTYTSEGSILVYFVARATFSHAPAQLKLTDFDVEDGESLANARARTRPRSVPQGWVESKLLEAAAAGRRNGARDPGRGLVHALPAERRCSAAGCMAEQLHGRDCLGSKWCNDRLWRQSLPCSISLVDIS